jgi:hypothetical protein
MKTSPAERDVESLNRSAYCIHKVRHLKTIQIVAPLVLAGCVPSLHPLFTDSDLVFDHQLLGTWSQRDSKDSWTFEKSGTNAYRLSTTDRPFAVGGEPDGKRSALFEAHLCRPDKVSFSRSLPAKFFTPEPFPYLPDFYRVPQEPVRLRGVRYRRSHLTRRSLSRFVSCAEMLSPGEFRQTCKSRR